MIRIPAILFAALAFCVNAHAQSHITGKVVRADNGEPIAGSSVFISNTSRGTVSDKEGNFELRNIPPGKYDLVISTIGYETSVYSFDANQLPLKLRVEMQVKIRELENVTVEPSVEEGWDKWGLTFTDYFLGATPNAAQCRIKNKEAIRFRYFKRSNRVIAYCDEPLEIENRALGYRIQYQLEDFEVSFKGNTSRYAGYVLFEDMDGGKKEVRKRWQRERDQAYYGSMMHFWRSFYVDSIQEEGFHVKRMWREPNLEKERVRELYKNRYFKNSNAGNVVVQMNPDDNRDSSMADSSSYYESILRQKDYTEHYGKDLLTADSILYNRAATHKEVYFPNYICISYRNELEDPAYLQYHHERRNPYFQHSCIWLVEPATIVIYPDGSYYPPQQVFAMSYWAWGDKMADMLPLDYEPFGAAPKVKKLPSAKE